MRGRIGGRGGERRYSSERAPLVNARKDSKRHGVSDTKHRGSKKRSSLRRVVPVEDYLNCVVQARQMLNDGRAREREGVFAIPDMCETRSVSEYSQDKHTMDEDDYATYLNSGSNRSSSGGDALRMALIRFCSQYGFGKDDWELGESEVIAW